mmetsp:Transcript_26770/g.63741  ORF Transcript_26770/g.63741 Transcript_26770/m.63741 type:complete len:832 (+) Transcript_26770:110-2605(+)
MAENVTCEVKICEPGGRGLFLPLFSGEQAWDSTLRGVLYLLGLLWAFVGVAIVADVFMSSIETITSKKRRVVDPKTGRSFTYKVWNDTVSNLTLMALGSSAPEILLSVIELIGASFFSGALGPSTIVGSAAFNLLVISAVCVMAIPSPEVRFIKEVPVFAITASFSLIAYLWLMFMVIVISKDVVDIWEGLVTFAMFPILVGLAFLADKGYFTRKPPEEKAHFGPSGTRLFDDMNREELAAAEVKLKKEYGLELSDEQIAKLLEKEEPVHKSKAAYRVAATRGIFGGKRVGEKVEKPIAPLSAVVPTEALPPPKGVPSREAPMPKATGTVEFAARNFAVSESIGVVKLRVKRGGDLKQKVTVHYETEDGGAKAGQDYVEKQGEVTFKEGDAEVVIEVEILDDNKFEEDEDFFVNLKAAEGVLGPGSRARIVIIDDDHPGVLSFEKDVYEVKEEVQDVVINVQVKRSAGCNGRVTCKFTTEAASATQGYDYVHTEGELVFEDGATSQEIPLTICSKGRYFGKEEFRLVLSEPEGGAALDHSRDGGPEQNIATIVILPNEVCRNSVDRVASLLRINRDKAALGAANWKEQLWSAVLVNGGDEEEQPGVYDWVMHIISVFWKVIFALIPPPDYCGGWACFCCSLGMIGLVTALVADLAGLLGCVVGLGDSITAITLVALGTSLPDTFASKTAAQQDPYADASIGNITGSNSVNVFLGLGLPWSIGAMYWAAMGQTPEWVERYSTEARIDFESLRSTGRGQFVVVGGDLGFSVGVFTGLAVVCIATLILRRFLFGGELGGPKVPKMLTGVFLVCLWILYIGLSAWSIVNNKGPCD